LSEHAHLLEEKVCYCRKVISGEVGELLMIVV